MKVTDDTKYVTCSRLPILLGCAHPMAPTKNEYLQEVLDKKSGDWVEPQQLNYSKYTDHFEDAIRNIILSEHPSLQVWEKLDREKPLINKKAALGGSLDDILYTKEPVTLQDAATGEDFTIQGACIFEYKTTGLRIDELPLYQGPVQVQGQMLCSNVNQAVVVRFKWNDKWQLEFFNIKRNVEIQKKISTVCNDFMKRTKTKEFYEPETDTDMQIAYPQVKAEEPVDFNDDEEFAYAFNKLEEGHQLQKDATALIDAATIVLKDKLKENKSGKYKSAIVVWDQRHYKAQPEKIVPAKEAYTIRSKKLKIKRKEEQ